MDLLPFLSSWFMDQEKMIRPVYNFLVGKMFLTPFTAFDTVGRVTLKSSPLR